MPEASLRRTEHGVVPEGDGWFVLNARDVPWTHTDSFGSACFFEGDARFPQLGLNVNVLRPGDGGGMYHAEDAQEGFLVLAGEGLAIVEGEERPLRAWDYFHCPAHTPHVLVATGDRPFVYVAVGARRDGRTDVVYPVDETARRHGMSVAQETRVPRDAYEGYTLEDGAYREGDLPEI